MRAKFDEQLNQLNIELLRMGSMIEDAIQKAVQALLTQDVASARIIMGGDDAIDQEQKKIENLCFQLLIQQQPVARDLRVITAAMKMVTDMERIGDHAADLAELTIMMSDKPYVMKQENIRQMVTETVMMLLHAIEAYVEKDMDKAREVIARDDVVDKLFLDVKKEAIELMKSNAAYEEHAADWLMADKYLERIGDHATNIAEWVIFALDNQGTAR